MALVRRRSRRKVPVESECHTRAAPNKGIEPTPSSLRYASASGRGSCLALGAAPVRAREEESTGQRARCRTDPNLERRDP